MSWVIVIWAMVASACLTLAVIYPLVWIWAENTNGGGAAFRFTLRLAEEADAE